MGRKRFTGKATRGAPVGSIPGASQTVLERIDAVNGGPNYHWRLGTDAGSTMTARTGGTDGAWINTADLVFGVDPITTNDASGKSVALGASSSAPGYGTISVGAGAISIASQHSFHKYDQVDRVADKMIALNTDQGGKVEGTFGYEYIDDNAGGMKVRMYIWGAAEELVEYTSADTGVVPIATAFSVAFVREDGGVKCWIDGVEIIMSLARGTPPASWTAIPNGSVLRVGVYGSNGAPFDGLISDLALWNAYSFTQTDALNLAIPTDAIYLKDFDAGTIEESNQAAISLLTRANPYAGITPSIVSQGARGTASVNGQDLLYDADPAEEGADSFTAKVTKGGVDSRTATVSISVLAAAVSPDVPFMGQAVGDHSVDASASNFKLNGSTVSSCQGSFFYAEKTGVVVKIRLQWRANGDTGAYSQGNGGTYTIQIRKANSGTKMPLDGASNIVCELTGYDADVNTSQWLEHTFTTQGQLIAEEPYFICAINTAADPNNNYVSWNISAQYYSSNSDPPPSGGWVPITLPNSSALMFPFSVIKRWAAESVTANRIGQHHVNLVYSDGIVTGAGGLGTWAGSAEIAEQIEGSKQVRQRFRPFAGHTFTADGLWIHIQRRDGSTGDLKIRIESGPASLTSGNGTLIEELTIAHGDIYNIGSRNNFNPGSDKVPWVFKAFSQSRTFTAGSIYSLRMLTNDSLKARLHSSARGEHANIGYSTAYNDFDSHEAGTEISMTAWWYSMGIQVSTDDGANWSFAGGSNRRTIPLMLRNA